MPRAAIGLWLTTAIWIAVTGGMWAYHDHHLRNGREVVLKTVPVDPRDLLRGDYVTLRYEISRAEQDDEAPPWFFAQNAVVFVTLEQADDEWAIGGVHQEAPDEGLFLRGRVRSSSERWADIVYGIESFFVPEGEGRRYEDARNRDRLWAVVRVSPHGVARLERLEIREGE
jgi:uncharacterized membrane-anchored protein